MSVAADGGAVLTSLSKVYATLFRTPGGPWNALYQGQTCYLSHGDQVSLDANNPEGAALVSQVRCPSLAPQSFPP